MLNSKYWKVIFPFQLIVIIIYLINTERFVVWGQIDSTIFQIINTPFQAHSIRIFLVGGLIYLGELIGFSEIITFNFFVTILLFVNIKILFKIFKSYSNHENMKYHIRGIFMCSLFSLFLSSEKSWAAAPLGTC